jgi:hypothetical protein
MPDCFDSTPEQQDVVLLGADTDLTKKGSGIACLFIHNH